MKKITLISALILCLSVQAQPRDWENPYVLGINKLPYHATLQLPSKWKECKEIVSLDGQWKFHWSKDPESALESLSTSICSTRSIATVLT